ncbi:MAG: glycosyltransferase [Dehalococcoidales bacterium]|nr:glycosyltransferase [Dehalococcoidales bacterium]
MERRLKIAMLSTHSCPMGKLGGKDTGGMSVWVKEVAAIWGRLGHSVDVFTRIKDLKDTHIVEFGDNARLIHLPAGNFGEISKLSLYNYLPDFAGNVENYRKENDLRYDLILSHYWLSGQAGRILQTTWNVPHIVMFHTLGVMKNTLVVNEPEPDLRLETEKSLTHGCCYIIAATPQEKRALVAHYEAIPENVFVIPCGVNMEMFRPVNKMVARQHIGFDGDKLVMFVGRIEALKGIDQLIKAIPLLPKEQDVRLLIAGGDEYSRPEIDRLKAFADSLGIENRVSFRGLIKQEQLLYYYSAADVCVSPSYYESFGLTPLESLACGTPVVVTDVGAAKDIIRTEAAGYVVPDNAPRVLADKIALVLARPNNAATAQQIRKSISGFNWGNTARASLKVCRKAVAKYSAPVPS